jgi:hypothetical protein
MTTTRTAAHAAHRQARRPARPAPCCPTADPRVRWNQRQDLEVVWLYTDPTDPAAVVERSHCTQCQPRSGYTSVDCATCGDGPMLAGELAAHTTAEPAPPAPVLDWLTTRGWRVAADGRTTCPGCTTADN